jgi:acetyl esterase
MASSALYLRVTPEITRQLAVFKIQCGHITEPIGVTIWYCARFYTYVNQDSAHLLITFLAKEHRSPKVDFQVLFYPGTDTDFDTPSYQQFATGSFLTREAMKWFWHHYAPNVATHNQPTASSLRASVDQLIGLPLAVVITGEFDVLHDEGEACSQRLIEAYVPVMATPSLGTIHGLVMLKAITDVPAPRAAIVQANDVLRPMFTK